MTRKKNKFTEAARATRKGKTIAGTIGSPPKRVHQEKEIIMLPPPPTTEKPAPSQPKSSSMGTLASVPVQHLTLALTWATFLLKEPLLSVLIAKSALRPRDRHRLNEVDTEDLYFNIIHFTMESALCAYMPKKRNKALR